MSVEKTPEPEAVGVPQQAPLPGRRAACPFAERVAMQVRDRAETGLRKYGVTCERTDIDFVGWVTHLQEELLDACVYLERLKAESRPESGATKERSVPGNS